MEDFEICGVSMFGVMRGGRGSGKTTKQLLALAAAGGGVYVCHGERQIGPLMQTIRRYGINPSCVTFVLTTDNLSAFEAAAHGRPVMVDHEVAERMGEIGTERAYRANLAWANRHRPTLKITSNRGAALPDLKMMKSVIPAPSLPQAAQNPPPPPFFPVTPAKNPDFVRMFELQTAFKAGKLDYNSDKGWMPCNLTPDFSAVDLSLFRVRTDPNVGMLERDERLSSATEAAHFMQNLAEDEARAKSRKQREIATRDYHGAELLKKYDFSKFKP